MAAILKTLLSILPNKTAKIMFKNWSQFLFVVTATIIKQQISQFYLQILNTDASI